MSATYYLKNDESTISYQVAVSTSANAGTLAYPFRSGKGNGKEKDKEKPSDPTANGNIPKTELGLAANYIGASLIVIVTVRPRAGQKTEDVYHELGITITLSGGVKKSIYTKLDGVMRTTKTVDGDRVRFNISINFKEQAK